MLIAHEQVLLVVLRVPINVGLLNAPAGGRVIARDCETYHAAVIETNLLLH